MKIAVLFALVVLVPGGLALVGMAASGADADLGPRLVAGGLGSALLAIAAAAAWSLLRSESGRQTLLLGGIGLVASVVVAATTPLLGGVRPWIHAVTGVDANRLGTALGAMHLLPMLWARWQKLGDELRCVVGPAIVAWPLALGLAVALESASTPRGQLFLPILYALVAIGYASAFSAAGRLLAAAGALAAFSAFGYGAASARESSLVTLAMVAGIAFRAAAWLVSRRRALATRPAG